MLFDLVFFYFSFLSLSPSLASYLSSISLLLLYGFVFLLMGKLCRFVVLFRKERGVTWASKTSRKKTTTAFVSQKTSPIRKSHTRKEKKKLRSTYTRSLDQLLLLFSSTVFNVLSSSFLLLFLSFLFFTTTSTTLSTHVMMLTRIRNPSDCIFFTFTKEKHT